MGKYIRDIKSADTWSVFKIISDFVKGFDELSDLGPSVTIFGGARFQKENRYYQAAYKLSGMLAKRGFNILTGGGPGIMEAANRGAYEAGGVESVGLNIELPKEQVANRYITKGLLFDYFFSRKVMFMKYSMAYVVFPGGFGTMDELFEALTLIQTKKMPGVKIFLYGVDYYAPLVEFMKTSLVKEKTISPEDIEIFELTDDLDAIVSGIEGSIESQLQYMNNLNLNRSYYYKELQKLKERISSTK